MGFLKEISKFCGEHQREIWAAIVGVVIGIAIGENSKNNERDSFASKYRMPPPEPQYARAIYTWYVEVGYEYFNGPYVNPEHQRLFLPPSSR